ncbi:hypothetical protein AAW51_4578 [Caldimonas brevitalea]|uniref:Flavoprotein WrbA n=1 Tax=Caldimonas brevitalea TaxID=413882 RepID=A0A0G3BPD0_9BURK|nr:hypothetical protein AAW51_4578 [Caldimonas brevitalea]
MGERCPGGQGRQRVHVTGSQHGGQEATLLSTHIVLLHLGMVVTGLPYTFKGQLRMDEITGGSPYGATTIADDGHGGDRQPTQNELDGARFQGRHVARLAEALRRARVADAASGAPSPGAGGRTAEHSPEAMS